MQGDLGQLGVGPRQLLPSGLLLGQRVQQLFAQNGAGQDGVRLDMNIRLDLTAAAA